MGSLSCFFDFTVVFWGVFFVFFRLVLEHAGFSFSGLMCFDFLSFSLVLLSL